MNGQKYMMEKTNEKNTDMTVNSHKATPLG
jgi:hypothetical protein